jgi:ABC-2 type transport system ATP-binding protein
MSKNVLSINSITKKYGDSLVLDQLSFDITSGVITGFLGPNGAGKTTVMRSIFGLIATDSGSVTWKGKPIGLDQLTTFGYLPEERGLYPKMPVIDQLIYFGQLHGLSSAEARSRTEYWLSVLGIEARSKDLLQSLSLGNQQRVQIISMILHRPELLVLDEPFSGLDPTATQKLVQVLRDFAKKGSAVLFSSHQLDLVQDICERVVIIDKGVVVAEGSIEQLRSTDNPTILVEYVSALKTYSVPKSVASMYKITETAYKIVAKHNTSTNELLSLALNLGNIKTITTVSKNLTEVFEEAISR